MLRTDLIVIGAGPAGMAGAIAAADAGLNVLLLDEQARAGGQIYRSVESAAEKRGGLLGHDYLEGLRLTQALNHPNITYKQNAVVWQIEEKTQVAFSIDGRAYQAQGQRLLIATGALERPMPVPGWTLPGVMTAGAAQILLKQSGVVCEGAVLAGAGPLLYLVAAQMIRAGAPPLALLETQTLTDLVSGLSHVSGIVQGWRLIAKGTQLLLEIQKAGIPRFKEISELKIEGRTRAEAVRFKSKGKEHSLACNTVLLHHGVVPNTQIARSIGVLHHWSHQQACFTPEKDRWGRTDLKDVFIAGDGGGIAGAKAAELSGRLAALEIACDLQLLDTPSRDRLAAPLIKRLKIEIAPRPFLDTAFPPFPEALTPADDTIICRCEEVTAGDIRSYARLGCLGPNQAKAFGRVGMGPCQGRYCGLTVTELLAQAHQTPHEDVGYYRIRPPLKPVTLGELATLAEEEEKEAAK